MSLKIGPNNFRTTLTAQLLSGGTSCTVLSAAALTVPPGDYMLLTLVRVSAGIETAWEIIRLTSIAGNVLTITRAQESTTALQWEIGEALEARITNGMLNTFVGGNTISQEFDSSSSPGVSALVSGAVAGPVGGYSHGFGVVPKFVVPFIINVTGDIGYVTNDIVQVSWSDFSSADIGLSYTATASNIIVRYGSAGSFLFIVNKTTGVTSAVANANWRFFVKAYA